MERWHQILKNCFLSESFLLPGDLEAQIDVFVDHTITRSIMRF